MTNREIIDTVSGFADGLFQVLHKTKLKKDDIAEIMLNAGYEECPTCKWWVETWERVPDGEDEPDKFCTNCRPIKIK